MELFGAIAWILDPGFSLGTLPYRLTSEVVKYVKHARDAYQNLDLTGPYSDLNKYIEASQDAIAQSAINPSGKTYLQRGDDERATISGIIFKLLGYEPFKQYLCEEEAGERLKVLNRLIAEYETLFNQGWIELEPSASSPNKAQATGWTRYNFYSVLVAGIVEGLNDPEDEEASVEPGKVNIMTIHQAKGLEFEVVFVLRPERQPFLSDTHIVEDVLDLRPIWKRNIAGTATLYPRRSQADRVAEDTVRLYFVAYSRAKRLLVIAGNDVTQWGRILPQPPAGVTLTSTSDLLTLGVTVL
jgi:DNA helicase-2/ATP-dependent DNA helicase PcrA